VNRSTLALILKLVLASFLVGMTLNFFDISPADLIHDIPQTVAKIYDAAIRIIKWSGKYILLGAIIVVPVWGLMNVTRLKDRFTRKK